MMAGRTNRPSIAGLILHRVIGEVSGGLVRIERIVGGGGLVRYSLGLGKKLEYLLELWG